MHFGNDYCHDAGSKHILLTRELQHFYQLKQLVQLASEMGGILTRGSLFFIYFFS